MAHKVLITASTYSHILSFHIPYLRELKNAGWTVHVGCGGEKKNIPFADEVIHVPFKKSMFSGGNLAAVRVLRKRLRVEDYELLITHTSLAAFFTRLALAGMGKRPRVINVVHGYLFDDGAAAPRDTLLLTAERMTAPLTDLLLTMNSHDYAAAKRHGLCRHVEMIPGMGVDFSGLHRARPGQRRQLLEEYSLPGDAFLLFFAAEFSRRKSQEVLVRAMELLPDNVVLILGGNGSRLDEVRRLAAGLGLEKRVIFPGFIHDIGPWYEMADAVVSSSRSEGLPFNIMEAMYCGTCVIASAVKGHTDLIRHGENGLLYPYGDFSACARAVRELMDSPALRDTYSQRAYSDVQKYSLDRVLPVVMESYGIVTGSPLSSR